MTRPSLPGPTPEETLTLIPQGIRPEVTYVFETPETGESRTLGGSDLLVGGFTVALAARSGAIWFYRRADVL